MCPELELPLPDMIDFRVTVRVNGQPYIQLADDSMIKNDTFQKLPMNLTTVSFYSITFNRERVSKNVKLLFVEEIRSYK